MDRDRKSPSGDSGGRGLTAKPDGVCFGWGDAELAGADNCTVLWINWTPANCPLSVGELYSRWITPQHTSKKPAVALSEASEGPTPPLRWKETQGAVRRGICLLPHRGEHKEGWLLQTPLSGGRGHFPLGPLVCLIAYRLFFPLKWAICKKQKIHILPWCWSFLTF